MTESRSQLLKPLLKTHNIEAIQKVTVAKIIAVLISVTFDTRFQKVHAIVRGHTNAVCAI